VKWWFKTKCRAGGITFMTLGLLATIVYASADFPAPRVGGVTAVPTSLIAPSLLAAALIIFRNSAAPINEFRAVRPLQALESGLTCALILLVCGLLLGGRSLYGEGHLLEATRNFLAYSGLALTLRYFSAGIAANSAIAYALLLAVLGSPTALWSFPLRSGSSLMSWVCAAALIVTGLAVSTARASVLRSELNT
jgi:hypothetical protein